MEKKWYVLHTYVGKEKKVKEALEKFLEESDLKEHFGQIVIPSHKTFIIRDGKKIVKERKIYPNYILIEMDMTPQTYQFVLQLPATTKFLGGNKNPKPLSEKEVNRILGGKKDKDSISSEMKFLVGDRIKIVDGPFDDFEGAIERILEDKEKLVVNVTVFGRITPVEVSFNQVEKLD